LTSAASAAQLILGTLDGYQRSSYIHFMKNFLYLAASAIIIVSCTSGSDNRANSTPELENNKPADPRSRVDVMAAAMNAAPDSVLHLLLTWDTAGLRFETEHQKALVRAYCYVPENDCMSEEPGWDVSSLVRGYSVKSLTDEPDSAAFVVTFDHAADVGNEYVDAAGVPAPDTVTFRRMNGQWRLVGVESQMSPHLGLRAALSAYAKTAADSARLKSLAAPR
jgi:hypothetical protein